MLIASTSHYQQTGPGIGNYENYDITTVPQRVIASAVGEATFQEHFSLKSGNYRSFKELSKTKYSAEYIAYNTRTLVAKIDNELEKWSHLPLADALPYISNIQELLSENISYLSQIPENRILLSLLELLFNNNNWENIDKGDINFLRGELVRFREGDANWKSIKLFSKQLFRKKIRILRTRINDEKETTN